ncbi:50S ribosomal protein L18e [Methanobrevibacter filiformis]|uniref:Large ribosomal subunit protein eL18 n=1 Tax=Methanobrevibacter filiformis TaxID=55758 RepID=A0A166A5B3_9EURY|nr:50S ribosomal protein L18e [Methanobrevibacter filiformis]KZX11591.1 50S ribosomal protein L15 [Methanobrevibacter filiformis]
MAKKIIKTNPNLINLIRDLKKKSNAEDVAIWKDISNRLSRSTRRRAEVNISSINRHSITDETVLIPGKVLSYGTLDHNVSVAALNFSENARKKIESAGGKCLSIEDIVRENPKGSNIRILE